MYRCCASIHSNVPLPIPDGGTRHGVAPPMSAADRRAGDPGGGERSVAAVLAALDAGQPPPRPELRTAVRYLLDLLAARAPGRAIEVRVPPYAAVQCGEGPRHTRGTPPNLVEMDPVTWVRLAAGQTEWADAVASGAVRASGVRADLTAFLPLLSSGERA